jgi:hypothetical protein
VGRGFESLNRHQRFQTVTAILLSVDPMILARGQSMDSAAPNLGLRGLVAKVVSQFEFWAVSQFEI